MSNTVRFDELPEGIQRELDEQMKWGECEEEFVEVDPLGGVDFRTIAGVVDTVASGDGYLVLEVEQGQLRVLANFPQASVYFEWYTEGSQPDLRPVRIDWLEALSILDMDQPVYVLLSDEGLRMVSSSYEECTIPLRPAASPRFTNQMRLMKEFYSIDVSAAELKPIVWGEFERALGGETVGIVAVDGKVYVNGQEVTVRNCDQKFPNVEVWLDDFYMAISRMVGNEGFLTIRALNSAYMTVVSGADNDPTYYLVNHQSDFCI